MSAAERVRRVALAAVLGTTILIIPEHAIAQDTGSESGARTRFASFDVGFGGVKPVDAEWGLSYGVAFDVANLFIRGASLRFGFRFWTADSEAADGRPVELDDSVFDVTVKKHFGPESLGAYAALGPAVHVVNARFRNMIDEKEERDGVRVGLEAILGLEKSLADEGFITLFLEGRGGLVQDVSQLALHVGIRIRFDRLGTGG
jgi:hypothetical protein